MTSAAFGMAGVIYTANGESNTVREESWVMQGFRMTAQTVRGEWRGEDAAAVTQQHAGETKTTPQCYRAELPQVGQFSGLLFGSFFGEIGGSETQLDGLTRKMLWAYGN